MKKVLVSGYIGFDNFGDEAIFYALVNHLKSLKVDVSVICNNPDIVNKKYNVSTCYYKSPLAILASILKCDILYSGGGSLLQNKTSNYSLYYYLLIILVAKLCFKKVFIFSQGIEPIQGQFHEFCTKTVLKLVDYITVRDEKSFNYLKKLNIKADITSDPVYSLVDNCRISDKKEGLVIQLRDFKGFNHIFLDELAMALKNYTGSVKVLSLQNDIDEKVCRLFVERLSLMGMNVRFVPFYSIERVFDIINEAEFVISTRLHGLIISNALRSKTFALVYDDKVKTLVDEFHIQNIDLRNYAREELNLKINNFLNKETEFYPYRKFDWSLTDVRLLKRI